LSWTCVDVESLRLNDFTSVIPLFSHLRVLRLPLRSRKGDSTESSTAIAKLSPSLETISWMQTVHFEGKADEYTIVRTSSEPSEVSAVRLTVPKSPKRELAMDEPISRRFSLFDTLFDSFLSPSKPSVLSDIAVTISVVVIVSSTLLSPFYVLFG